MVHFFAMSFYAFAQTHDYFDGLQISNCSLFSQMFHKELRKYFTEEMCKNVNFDPNPSDTILQVIKAYNQHVFDLLGFYFKRAKD